MESMVYANTWRQEPIAYLLTQSLRIVNVVLNLEICILNFDIRNIAMFDFFPDQPAFQYPDMVNIAYSFGWAFVLASMIAITHRVTFHGDAYPKKFFQAMVLGSIVTAMVMMAIGDSLARGLGVFGAMAIIRFSTRIDDPRNVLFLFAALSCGLAVGVFGFAISFAGTAFFCLAALVLHFSPFRTYVHGHKLEVIIANETLRETVEKTMTLYCGEFRQIGVSSTKENLLRLEYSLSLKSVSSKNELVQDLKKIEGIQRAGITATEQDSIRM
jgi:hypothetical protein